MGSKRRNSRNAGNMLMMTAVVGGIVLTVITVGVLICILFLSQKRAQGQVDEVALSMATLLNRGNYSGQMNELVEHSRELVFISRNAYQEAGISYSHLEPLARQLLEESRNGARTVESGRQSLVREILKQLRDSARSNKARLATSNTFMIPWLSTYPLNINKLDIGFIERVQSNVQAPAALPDLKKYDIDRRYVEASSSIYMGNINATLPGADSDLVFKLSSLAAPVDNTVAPSRLTSERAFKRLATVIDGDKATQGGCDQLPSAVRLDLLMTISSEFGANNKRKAAKSPGVTAYGVTSNTTKPSLPPDNVMQSQAKVTASAAANGAMPPQ